MFRKLLVSCLVFLLGFIGVTPVFAMSSGIDQSNAVSGVYVMTNATSGNQVIAYHRNINGTLVQIGAYETGGQGSGVGITVPPDPLGSQNSLLLSPDGKWLFAVNAGSDSISVFRTRPDGLNLVGSNSSHGNYPVSLTFNQGHLFVLNAGGDGTIAGFSLTNSGDLEYIPGSTRSLAAGTPADGSQPNILEAPAQLGFSPDGKFLIVTDKGGVTGKGKLDVFPVDATGLPKEDFLSTTTSGPVPFSFVFDQFGHLVVDDAANNTVTSYTISGKGELNAISSVATGQAATCWIAITPSGTIYTDNTGAGSISALTASPNGQLKILNSGAPEIATGANSLPLDMALSHDGRFLYSLETGAGKVGIFEVQPGGGLQELGKIGGFSAVSGTQGIAAW